MANDYLVRYLTVGYCFFLFGACTTLLKCVSNEIFIRRWPMQTVSDPITDPSGHDASYFTESTRERTSSVDLALTTPS